MLEAISNAIDDTGVSQDHLKSYIDSIDIVRTWTWPYADLPGLLSERLDLKSRPKWRRYTETHGGNQPAKLLDEAAGRIARGESSVAVVTGGEALASCERFAAVLLPATQPASLGEFPSCTVIDMLTLCFTLQVSACAKAGNPEPPGWTPPETPVQEVFSPSTADLGQGSCILFLNQDSNPVNQHGLDIRKKTLAVCTPSVRQYMSILCMRMRFEHIGSRVSGRTMRSRRHCMPNLPRSLPRISTPGIMRSRPLARRILGWCHKGTG